MNFNKYGKKIYLSNNPGNEIIRLADKSLCFKERYLMRSFLSI